MGRGNREQGERTRQAILDAALDLYAESGARGTGLAAIGERAGISHATVLYHYGSSRALLLAVLAEQERLFAEQTAPAWTEGGLAALRNLPEVARFNVANPGLSRLLTVLQPENLSPTDGGHEHFVRRRRALHEVIVTALRDGVAAGDIRAGVDADLKADEVISFMDGAQLMYALDPERVPLVALYQSYTDALVRDLTTAP